jgi:general secretion pathway protein G
MLVRQAPKAASRTGFTLVEMLVVVAIIVILAGVAVPITLGVLDEARKDTARTNIAHIVQAINTYRIKNQDNFPSSLEELAVDPRVGLKADQLLDPWGKEFQFSPTSSHGSSDGFDVWTVAKDGEMIGNWPKGR